MLGQLSGGNTKQDETVENLPHQYAEEVAPPTSISYLALTKDDEKEIPTWVRVCGEKPAIGDIFPKKEV